MSPQILRGIKTNFKKYVFEDPNPDAKVFAIMHGILPDTLEGNEFAKLRELAHLKRIEYLTAKMTRVGATDTPLSEPIVRTSSANHIYDAMSGQYQPDEIHRGEPVGCNGVPCKFVLTKIKSQRKEWIVKICKEVIFFLACSGVLLICAIWIVRLMVQLAPI